MSKRTYIELGCDQCKCGEHYNPFNWMKEAREKGWIITASGNHFCSKECYNKYKKG